MRRLLATLLITLAATAVSAKPSEGERFNAWLDATWEETLIRRPILATLIGDSRYNDRIVDFTTAAWRADNRRFLERQLRELKRFDRTALVGQDRLSYDILKHDLTQSLDAERFPDWMQPVNQLRSFPSFLAEMGSGSSIQPFRTVKDYEDWYKRLSGTPPILDGMIANMRIGLAKGVTQPKPVMEKVIPQLAALVTTEPEQSLFWGPMKNFPETIPAADRERLAAAFRTLIKEQVAPAYQRMHDFVRDEYIPRARTTTAWSALPDGKAWYAYYVRRSTTTTLSPDAIHALGESEVHRIWDEMDAVRREVKFDGDLPAFFRHLQDDPRFYYTRPEELLGGFRDLQTKINGLLPKLFDIAPKADYRVQEVEAFRAASSEGATYMPPAADGSRPGIFYVNTYNLKAQPIFGMETLSLHEASPGHHFQISIAQEVTSLPKFRRFATGYVAYSEGWALYAESIGKELGTLHRSVPVVRAPVRRAATCDAPGGRYRLAPQGLEPRQQAIDYMLDALVDGGKRRDRRGRALHRQSRPGARLQDRPAGDPPAASRGGVSARIEIRRQEVPPRGADERRTPAECARSSGQGVDCDGEGEALNRAASSQGEHPEFQERATDDRSAFRRIQGWPMKSGNGRLATAQ